MGNQFHPDFYIQNMSSIDPARLKARGIRLAVIDMDNTLIPSCEMVVPAQAHRFIDALRKEGIMPVVVSNNVSRITRSRCEQLQIACYPFSLKPLPRGFRKVLRRYHCSPQETAVIGDQILTDIFGGNHITIYPDGSAHLDNGTLAGSTLNINKGLRILVEEAMVPFNYALNACTINPARCLHVDDRKGSIRVGKDADLVVLEDNYDVLQTYCMGQAKL